MRAIRSYTDNSRMALAVDKTGDWLPDQEKKTPLTF